MIKHILICILIFCTLVLSACYNEPDCEQVVAYDYVKLGFYDIETKLEKKNRFVNVGAIGSDSIFYPNNVTDSLNVLSLKLNLNPMGDRVVFWFRTASTRDTLIVDYKRAFEWVSDECGPILKYSDLQMEYHTFDSAVLKKDNFGDKVTIHIAIYN